MVTTKKTQTLVTPVQSDNMRINGWWHYYAERGLIFYNCTLIVVASAKLDYVFLFSRLYIYINKYINKPAWI